MIAALHQLFTLMLTLFAFYSIPEPTPSTMTALHQFGAEMLKLSRGLQSFAPEVESTNGRNRNAESTNANDSEPSKHHEVNVER